MPRHSLMYLYDLLVEDYNSEWLDFEPEIIREIETHDGNKIGDEDINANKVFALQTAINSQMDDEGFYFDDWQVFEKIVLTINGVVPDFTEVEEVEPHEIHAAIEILKMINENIDFGKEVIAYITASYQTESIVYCPFYDEVNDLLEDSELKDEVKKVWNKLPEKKDEEIVNKIANLEDDVKNIQIKRLTFIQEYAKALVMKNEQRE